jgi:3-deoxy-D-arabino-heptulosonate 7-phosphate (DAHP) synthase
MGAKDGCVKPAAGPISPEKTGGQAAVAATGEEAAKMIARVGKEAPDFETTAFIPASGDFQNVKLSTYKGKWITLCFYPGDFTFV